MKELARVPSQQLPQKFSSLLFVESLIVWIRGKPHFVAIKGRSRPRRQPFNIDRCVPSLCLAKLIELAIGFRTDGVLCVERPSQAREELPDLVGCWDIYIHGNFALLLL